MKKNSKKNSKNNRFLAKWLSKEVSQGLLMVFEKSNDYQQYTTIIEGLQKLGISKYNFEIAYSEFSTFRETILKQS